MNIRNNNGITLMSEVVAVLLLIIIVSIISYSSKSSLQVKNLNNMYTDIVNIQERATNYYLKYRKAPITEEKVPNNVIEEISNETNPKSNSKSDKAINNSGL